MRITRPAFPTALLGVGLILLSCESVKVEGPTDPNGGGNVTVSSVTVSPSSFSISVGATQQLSATVRGSDGSTLTNRTVSWISSSTGVATVTSGGLVTGVNAGSATITATVEGVSGTAAGNVGNPTPVITSLSPSSGNVGQVDLEIAVIGSGFVPGSVVRVNGGDRGTEYVSTTELRSTIGNDEMESVGQLQITVFNPSPGGGTSSAVTFEIGACPKGVLSPEGEGSGNLVPGDCRLDDGSLFHTWEFQGTAGALYQVRMESGDFDTNLIITDPDAELAGFDDDGGQDTNSRVTFKAPSSGSYLVFARSLNPGQDGAYDIRLSQVVELNLGSGSPSAVFRGVEGRAGESSDGSPLKVEGVPADRFGFIVEYPLTYMAQVIRAPGSSLDVAAEMFELTYNPVGGSNDTDPVFGSTSGGELIVAQSEDDRYGSLDVFAAGGTSGNYELFVQECRFFELNLGNMTSSTLSPATDCTLFLGSADPSVYFASVVIGFYGEEGDGVRLTVNSSWRSDLLLMAPDGTLLARDVADNAGAPATIAGTLVDDGLHMAVLSTWDPGVSGSFSVSLQPYSGTPAQPAPGESWEMNPGKGGLIPTNLSNIIRGGHRSDRPVGRAKPLQKSSVQDLLDSLGFFKLNLARF